jgi:hypothetical protein
MTTSGKVGADHEIMLDALSVAGLAPADAWLLF